MMQARAIAAFVVAVALSVSSVTVSGATFTNKRTREVITGRLLGVVVKNGTESFFVRTEDGRRHYLSKADWMMVEDASRPPKAKLKPKPQYPWPELEYNGKVRDAAWLEKQYADFKHVYTFVNGDLVNLTTMLLIDARMDIGLVRVGPHRVVQVLSDDEMLVETGLGEKELLHLKGVSTKSVVDGRDIDCNIVAVGTYRYTTVMAATKQIFDCRPLPLLPRPLTEEQFVSSLRKGLKLMRLKVVREEKSSPYRLCPRCMGTGKITVRKKRASGMNWEWYRTSKQCPQCGGRGKVRRSGGGKHESPIKLVTVE